MSLWYRSLIYKGSSLIISSWSRTKSQLFLFNTEGPQLLDTHTHAWTSPLLSFQTVFIFHLQRHSWSAATLAAALNTCCIREGGTSCKSSCVSFITPRAAHAVFRRAIKACVSPSLIMSAALNMDHTEALQITSQNLPALDSPIQLAAVNTQIRELSVHSNPPLPSSPSSWNGEGVWEQVSR